MYDSFASQLAGLDLSGFSITPAPFNEADFPCEDAMATKTHNFQAYILHLGQFRIARSL